MATTVTVLSPTFGTGPATAVGLVNQTFNSLNTRLNGYQEQFNGALTGLLQLPNDNVGFAEPDLNFTLSPPPQLSTSSVGDLDLTGQNDPGMQAPQAPPLNISLPSAPLLPERAAPSMDAITLPAAPVFAVGAAPARPVIDMTTSLPDAPSIPSYILEPLTAVDVPDFTAPVLASFDEAAPLFDAVAPTAAINWTEPVYESENFDAVLATLTRMREGSTGLPPAIEEQIFERARAREDRTGLKAVQEAYDAFAGRGFIAPPGALQAQLDDIRERNQLQANALQREIMVKITDVQIENLRFAVTQGLAAEQILANIFNNAAQRSFEAAKFAVESLLALYNAKVSVFNAVTSAYQTRAQVYKTIIDGQLAALQVYRLEIEGAKLTSELNQQKVQTYTALLQSTQTAVEVYKAQIQGAQTKVELARTAIEAYKADVSAFAETVGAEKLKVDAYKSQVDAAVATGQVNQSRASVFSTLVQADASRVQSFGEQARVEIGRLQATTGAYTATLEGYKANVTAFLGRIEADARVKGLALQAIGVENQAVQSANEAAIRIGEQKLQSNVAKANTAVKLYEVNVTKINQQADLRARSLQAAGQMLSTLAGGAMAAQHVSAGISASASDGYSRSESIQNSLQESIRST